MLEVADSHSSRQGHNEKPSTKCWENDAKRNARPGRDDRTVWLLVFHIRLNGRKQPIDRPVRDESLFPNANPA
jgi:hypothetical protein